MMADPAADYDCFVEPGDVVTRRAGSREQAGDDAGSAPPRLPQMPAYHLRRGDHSGITMVNIGVGPANAKTITDHIAVLRPHAWLMLGHCAGLRNTQELGDYVLAHGYVREDHVLDEELPLWVPIPALAEVQLALEQAVADVTRLQGYELKKVLRTGTVASTDNRNWELLPNFGPQRRFSQSRAVALDMESATIAANGFRFRVPYGTLAVRQRQAAARRDQAAGHGQHLLPRAGRPAPANRHPRRGTAAPGAARPAAQPQAAQLCRGGVSVADRQAGLATLRAGLRDRNAPAMAGSPPSDNALPSLRAADLLGGAQAWQALLDVQGCGVVVYDAKGCLVTCNEDFRRQYAPIAEQMVPGASFEQLLAPGAGTWPGAAGRGPGSVMARVATARVRPRQRADRAADGGWPLAPRQ